MEILWISILFLLQISGQTTAQNVNLTFLTSVHRLNTSTTMDYYFCCNVVGGFIQWEFNNEPLSGFLSNDVGRVVVDVRNNYTYTATLLSSQPTDNSQTKLDSIVIISVANNTDPVNFTITCSSNLGVQSITSGATVDPVKNSNHTGEEIQLDYVVSGHIVSAYFTTHIFICGVREPPQFIEVTGPALGFSNFDNVGQARTIFSEDRSTALVQGILIARERSQAVTMIFAVADADIVVSCYDRENRISLPSLKAEKSPVVSTYFPMETTAKPSVSSVKSSKGTTSFTTSMSNVEEAGSMIWFVPAGIVIVVAFTIITALVAVILYKKKFSKRKSRSLKVCELGQDRNEEQLDCITPSKISLSSQAPLVELPVENSSLDRMRVAQASDHGLSKLSVVEDASDRNVNRGSELFTPIKPDCEMFSTSACVTADVEVGKITWATKKIENGMTSEETPESQPTTRKPFFYTANASMQETSALGSESFTPIKPDCEMFSASACVTADVEVGKITWASKKIENGMTSEETPESQPATRKPFFYTANASMQETSALDDHSNVSYVIVGQDRIYHLNHCKVIERPSVDSPGIIYAEVAPVTDASKSLVHFDMTNKPTASSNQFEPITNHDESSSVMTDGSKVETYPK